MMHQQNKLIEYLESFDGSYREFFEAVARHLHGIDAARCETRNGAFVFQFSTGGWTFNETLMDWIQGTEAHEHFWEAITRSGQHTYVVPFSVADQRFRCQLAAKSRSMATVD